MNMEKPGGLPSDFNEWMAAQRALRLPPATLPPAISPRELPATSAPVSSSVRLGFALQSGGSKVFAGAAERIGSALGSAHRQLRHGLELVNPLDCGEDARRHPSEEGPARPREDDSAARMMQEIEDAVAEIRREAAGRLISLQSRAEPNLQDSRGDWRSALSRIRMLVVENPARTIAAIAGFCLALGAARRLRKTHR